MMVLAGCDKRPEGVLSDKDMVALIADMQTAEAYMQNYNSGYASDSIRDSAVQWVLDRRGLSRADFDSTMTWYGKNIDEYRELYDKVDKELIKRQKQISGEEVAATNFSDLWPYSRHFMMTENSNTNSISFSLPGDQLQKGDRLNWKMRMNGSPAVSTVFGVEYDNGLTAFSYQNNSDFKKLDMQIQTDSSLTVKRIFGYVRVKEDRYLPVWIDSVSLQSSPLDTTQYYKVFSQRKIYPPLRRNEKTEENVKKDSVKISGISVENTISPPAANLTIKHPDRRRRRESAAFNKELTPITNEKR